MANDATPYYDPADVVTGYCEAAVTGKRFVKISGPRVDGLTQVSPGTAGAACFGVAVRDAAITARVGIARVGIWPVTAGEALAAGDPIASDGTGKAVVAAAGEKVLGWVIDDVDEDDDAPIALHLTGSGPTAATDVVGDQAAVADLVNNTGQVGDNAVANIPDVAAAAATAVTDAMLTDGTVDAAGVNAQLAALAADIIAKVNAVKATIEADIADLTDKQNATLAALRAGGFLAP